MATLDFKGKTLVQNYHLTVKYHELVPKKDMSLTDKVRLDDNLIIHGDNLKALKALLPTYAGKVKCIYIDPPYNTGNEGWKYNDNVNSPMMQEWLGKAVDREDLTRHDKWLCMMLPRLKLLRELLAQDGVVFVSIDDNEVHHLRVLLDEVFGAENFVGHAVWQKKYSPQNDAKTLSEIHEYVVGYAKCAEKWRPNLLARSEEAIARYKNPDNDPRGVWKAGDLTSKTKAAGHSYTIVSPSGKKFTPTSGRQWAASHDTYERLVTENRLWFGPRGDSVPSLKQFLSEVQAGTVPTTLWLRDMVGDNQEAVREQSQIGITFDSPKPKRLIEHILKIATLPKANDIILDFTGGSGTTAHDVLALNKEDGGNRKFILVECEDYADTITAERVRRVIKGVRTASDENLKRGLGGTFSYFELGKAIELDSILDGKNLPSYLELARYVFYTATGEEFDERKLNEKRSFVGESKTHEVYLFYQPDIDHLKKTALTLERAESLGKIKDKRRLVFAPTKYLDQEQLDALRIDFAQLPFEIYKLAQ